LAYAEYVFENWQTKGKFPGLKNLHGKNIIIMTDPISDMLNRIRNAQAVLKPTAVIPFSKLKYQIAEILEKEGFIGKARKKGRGKKKVIEVWLKYESPDPKIKTKKGVISGLNRISKPGQRIYVSANNIRKIKKGYGIAVVSTSKGLITDKEARKQKIGGEVLFEVW